MAISRARTADDRRSSGRPPAAPLIAGGHAGGEIDQAQALVGRAAHPAVRRRRNIAPAIPRLRIVGLFGIERPDRTSGDHIESLDHPGWHVGGLVVVDRAAEDRQAAGDDRRGGHLPPAARLSGIAGPDINRAVRRTPGRERRCARRGRSAAHHWSPAGCERRKARLARWRLPGWMHRKPRGR